MDTPKTQEIDFLDPHFFSNSLPAHSSNDDLQESRQLKTRLYDYVNAQLDKAENLPPKQVETLLKLFDRLETEALIGKHKGVPVKIKYFNDHFSKLFFSSAFFKIIYGGSSTGKSHCALAQYPLKRIIEEEGIIYYAVRLTFVSLRGSVFESMKKVAQQEGWEKYLKFKDTGSEMSVTSLTTGSKIIFKGCHNVDDFLSQHATGFLIEEATQIEEKWFDEFIRRIRGGDDSKKEIIMCFNPKEEGIWIKNRFFNKEGKPKEDLENVFFLQCTYENNKFLTDEDIARIEEMKERDPIAYEVYRWGNWHISPEGNRVSFFIPLE